MVQKVVFDYCCLRYFLGKTHYAVRVERIALLVGAFAQRRWHFQSAHKDVASVQQHALKVASGLFQQLVLEHLVLFLALERTARKQTWVLLTQQVIRVLTLVGHVFDLQAELGRMLDVKIIH